MATGNEDRQPDGDPAGPVLDLTILIPALNEANNLQSLLPEVDRVLREIPIDFEILVVVGGLGDDTRPLAEKVGARLIRQTGRGYGRALSEGFAGARGEYVLTMDADYSHQPAFIRTLWENRGESELLIASRYIANGSAETGLFRSLLSRLLNGVYRRFLRLPFRDLSSGFRIYRMAGLRKTRPGGRDFDFLPEVLALMHEAGLEIREVPFHYQRRREGRSRVKLIRFGWAYGKTLVRLRRLRKAPPPTALPEPAPDHWTRERKLTA
jgi:glycosyltransferase involved in cell wall biosynthesis